MASRVAGFVTRIALGGVVASVVSAGAMAAPVTFTWTPTGAGLTGGVISNADNFNVADFAS
ncbi:MAG: hypothetical protein JOZ05_01580, partial [Acetobacteraceae bacterium]|nr:hypothetical protein [Acetobacteraceae bacterium]